MTTSVQAWTPNHDTVVMKLHSKVDKLGIKKADVMSGVPIHIGPNVDGS